MTSAGNSDYVEGVKAVVLSKDISSRIAKLSSKDFAELEKTLSESDLCSLIFLLCDKYKDEIFLHDLCDNLLTDDFKTANKFWPFGSQGILLKYMHSTAELNWKEKIIEALLVMQIYRVLKKWQFDVNHLKITFKSTSRWNAVYINPLRKLLYLLCDDLSEDDWRTLCTAVNIEVSLSKDDKQQYGLDFPEISLLYWSSKQIINIKSPTDFDISIIRKNLPHIKRDDWVAILSDLSADNCFSISNTLAPLSSFEQYRTSTSKPVDLNDRYEINEEKPGVCVIFNQELVKGYDEPREGTRRDAEYLEKTFRCFGFDVRIRNNIPADKILHEICFFSVIEKPMSCYVVAILSHGERNVVKGSDGGNVNIDAIESTMLHIKSLVDKPKVLIIQACQADPNYSNDIATDGGRKGNLFVYMAALPGDVAYRHKYLGSYFINHLCDTLLENSQNANWLEVERICNAKMEKEKFAYLMPWQRSAYTKHLVLIAKCEADAKKVLHEELERRRNYSAKKMCVKRTVLESEIRF